MNMLSINTVLKLNDSKSRLKGIDVLRIICAFLVVCIHCNGYLYEDYIMPLARTAVPVFFIISGYFLYNDVMDVVKKRVLSSIKKISVIFILSTILYSIYALIISINTQQYGVFGNIGLWKLFVFIVNSSPLLFPCDFHLWFLIALIEGDVFFFLMYNKISNKILMFVVVSLILLHLNIMINPIRINIINKVLSVPFRPVLFQRLPCLIIGYSIAKYKFRLKKKCLLFLLCLLMISSLYEYNSNVENEIMYSTPLLSIIIFILFKNLPQKYGNSPIYAYMAKMGQDVSLYVYIVHVLVIRCFNLEHSPFWVFIISIALSYLYIYAKLFFKKLYNVVM